MNTTMWVYCVVLYILSVGAPVCFRMTGQGLATFFSWGVLYHGIPMFNIWGMFVTYIHLLTVLYPTFSVLSRWCKGPSTTRPARKLAGYEIFLLILMFVGSACSIILMELMVAFRTNLFLSPLFWMQIANVVLFVLLLIRPFVRQQHDLEGGAIEADIVQQKQDSEFPPVRLEEQRRPLPPATTSPTPDKDKKSKKSKARKGYQD